MTAFELWVRRNLADPLPLKQVAGALGVSERTLQRVTASVVGISPMDFVHEIRLDQATFLLRTTTMSAEAITRAVGYQHLGTLRALIRRRHGSTLTACDQELTTGRRTPTATPRHQQIMNPTANA
ncbi:MAG: helix-turn-helix domain-containing protein [Pseudonocardiaceae bacterium]